MSETALEDYLIRRDLDEPIAEHTFDAVAEQAGEILQELDDEGIGIRWVRSDVRAGEDGTVTGTFCYYRAENEEVLHEHADRSGLPVTWIDRLGKTLESEQETGE